MERYDRACVYKRMVRTSILPWMEERSSSSSSSEEAVNDVMTRSLLVSYAGEARCRVNSRVRTQQVTCDNWRVRVSEEIDSDLTRAAVFGLSALEALMAQKRCEVSSPPPSLEAMALLSLWRTGDSCDWSAATRAWFSRLMREAVREGTGELWRMRNRLVIFDLGVLRSRGPVVMDTSSSSSSSSSSSDAWPVSCGASVAPPTHWRICEKNAEWVFGALGVGDGVCETHAQASSLDCWSEREMRRAGYVNASRWLRLGDAGEWSEWLNRLVVCVLPPDFDASQLGLCGCVERVSEGRSRDGNVIATCLSMAEGAERFGGCRVIRAPMLRSLQSSCFTVCDDDEDEPMTPEMRERVGDREAVVDLNFVVYDCRTWRLLRNSLDAWCIQCLMSDCHGCEYVHYDKYCSVIYRECLW